MKWGYYYKEKVPPIKDFTDGAHIVVLHKTNYYISNVIDLEDDGWEFRDCIKIQFQNESLQAGLLRKPFKGTVANNVIKNGCGGINIDGCRVGDFTNTEPSGMNRWNDFRHGKDKYPTDETLNVKQGRFPANLILECTCEEVIEGKSDAVVIATHTDSKCPCKKLDTQSGITKAVKTKKSDNRVENNNQVFGKGLGLHTPENSHKDSGGASRFFISFRSRDELKEYLTTMIRC